MDDDEAEKQFGIFWDSAIDKYRARRPYFLSRYLRAPDMAITQAARDFVADVIDGKVEFTQRRGDLVLTDERVIEIDTEASAIVLSRRMGSLTAKQERERRAAFVLRMAQVTGGKTSTIEKRLQHVISALRKAFKRGDAAIEARKRAAVKYTVRRYRDGKETDS